MEIRKLNMLRGLAALIVLVSHFSNDTNWLNAILGKGAGQFGVMLFFILSGFLMSYLYMGKESSKFNIKKYAIARVARVLPLFMLVVVFSYVLNKVGVVGVLYRIPDAELLISHMLLIKGVNVLWTVGPEIQFYVIFAVIWWSASWKSSYLFILMALTLILLFFQGLPSPKGSMIGLPYDFSLFRSLPYFLVGVIFGKYYSSFKESEHPQSGWFVLALLIIPLMYPEIFHRITGVQHRVWSDIGVLAMLSLVFFSIVFLVPDNNMLMANRFGDFLGKISYSLYLLHLPVLWQLNKHNFLNIETKLLVFIFSSLVVSYMSYRLIELPLSRLIRQGGLTGILGTQSFGHSGR